MEEAAAAARAAREREQKFLRAASLGALADVEALLEAGASVAATVRARALRRRAGLARRLVASGAQIRRDPTLGEAARRRAAAPRASRAARAPLTRRLLPSRRTTRARGRSTWPRRAATRT